MCSADIREGEIINVLADKVVCWLGIGNDTRVRCALDRSFFNAVPYVGMEFLWFPEERRAESRRFENDDLIAACDRLDREWRRKASETA